MLNDFFKNNVNLGASFVMRTGNTGEVFCADMATADGRDCYVFTDSGIFSQGIRFFFALTVTALMAQRGLIFLVCEEGMLEFLLSFLVAFSRKMDSINSTIRNMLIMSVLLSAVIFPSVQRFSKSDFNRLTSVLTEVLSKLAINVNTLYV